MVCRYYPVLSLHGCSQPLLGLHGCSQPVLGLHGCSQPVLVCRAIANRGKASGPVLVEFVVSICVYIGGSALYPVQRHQQFSTTLHLVTYCTPLHLHSGLLQPPTPTLWSTSLCPIEHNALAAVRCISRV